MALIIGAESIIGQMVAREKELEIYICILLGSEFDKLKKRRAIDDFAVFVSTVRGVSL